MVGHERPCIDRGGLNDGSVICGEINSYNGGIYTLKSNALGTVKIEESKIRAIRSCRDYIIFQSYVFFKGAFPAEAKRVTQEFVTPRCRATAAPEYHNSCTANQDTIVGRGRVRASLYSIL